MDHLNPFEETLRNATLVSVVFFDFLSDKLELELSKNDDEFKLEGEVDSARSLCRVLSHKFSLLKRLERIVELSNTFYGHFIRLEFNEETMKRLSRFKTNVFEERESDENEYKNSFSLLAKIEFEMYGFCSDQNEKSDYHKRINDAINNFDPKGGKYDEYREQFERMKKQFESVIDGNKSSSSSSNKPSFNSNSMNFLGFPTFSTMNQNSHMLAGFDMMNSLPRFPNQFMSSPFDPMGQTNMNFDFNQQTPESLFNNSFGMANQMVDFISSGAKDFEKMAKFEQENKKCFKKFLGKVYQKIELLRVKLEKSFNYFNQILSQLDAEDKASERLQFVRELRDQYFKTLLSNLICKSNQIHELLGKDLSNQQFFDDESKESNSKESNYVLLNKDIERLFELVEKSLKKHLESIQNVALKEIETTRLTQMTHQDPQANNTNIQVVLELIDSKLSLKCSENENKKINFGNEIFLNGIAYQRKTTNSNDQLSSLPDTSFRCTMCVNPRTNTHSVCLQILPKIEPIAQLSEESMARLKRENAKFGSVQISLFWNNENDLDLHVVDPNNEEISYNHKKSRSGGELDVDMNARSRVSRSPVENVVWTGQAPQGHYKVYVNYYSKKCNEDLTQFTVSVFANGLRKEFRNEMKKGDSKKLIYEFDII